LRVAVVKSEKLVVEARDSSETQRKVNILVEAAIKQQLVKTERTSCIL
jgi:hypothetical protein